MVKKEKLVKVKNVENVRVGSEAVKFEGSNFLNSSCRVLPVSGIRWQVFLSNAVFIYSRTCGRCIFCTKENQKLQAVT